MEYTQGLLAISTPKGIYPRCIGEVGIDYSDGIAHKDRGCQKEVLQKVLPMAKKLRLPVIVHCRGPQAQEACFEQLSTYLPRNHFIHHHCFMGSPAEVWKWIEAFSNVMFGFTGAICRDKGVKSEWYDAVVQLPLNKILLETDAPFLIPPKFEKMTKDSNPGMIGKWPN